MLGSSGCFPCLFHALRHQRDGVLAQVILHVVEEVRLDVAGEWTLETLIFERFARRTGNVMGFLRFSPLKGFHSGAIVQIQCCLVCQSYLPMGKKKRLTVLPHLVRAILLICFWVTT